MASIREFLVNRRPCANETRALNRTSLDQYTGTRTRSSCCHSQLDRASRVRASTMEQSTQLAAHRRGRLAVADSLQTRLRRDSKSDGARRDGVATYSPDGSLRTARKWDERGADRSLSSEWAASCSKLCRPESKRTLGACIARRTSIFSATRTRNPIQFPTIATFNMSSNTDTFSRRQTRNGSR